MSETAAESTPDGNEGGATSAAQDFKPITTPAELDAFLKDRVARAERKATEKFADYDSLKTKASQFDALSEASKTEQEKLQERIAAMEERATQAEIAALRSKYAADVPEKLRPLLTGRTDEELAAQRDLIVQGESDRKKNGNVVPREGTSTRPAESDDSAFARALFSRE